MKEQAIKIIEYWSSFPCFTRHTDPTKKAYSMSMWMLKTLFEGKQGEKMPLDDDFLSDNAITNEELQHKFTVEEIKSAIDKYAQMNAREYVADKSKWSRSLDYFIYNDKTRRSFFLTLTGGREIPGTPTKPLDNDVVDDYHKVLMVKIIDDDMRQKFIRSVNYVVLQQRDWQDKYGQYFHSHELKDDGFYRYHRQYISLNYRDREDFRIDHIGAMTFIGFIVWLWEYHGITYKLSKEDVERAKARYARDQARIDENNRLAAERALEREKWKENRVFRDNVRQNTSENNVAHRA